VPGSAEFPKEPVPAVGALVFRGEEVLLVKRGTEPNKGFWSIPGGVLEVGETVQEAVVRETREETNVLVQPRKVFGVSDYIESNGSAVTWHYILIDVLCDYVSGEPFPATDAENARFIPLRELGEYDLAPAALEVVQAAAKERGSASPPGPL